MKVLVTAKLSPNKMITNSGYLICNNAILARTGKQEYLKSEIYPDCSDDSIIEVDRRPEQVFSEATLASFENVPLTCEHPDENVTPDNYKEYAVGYVRDVHKGEYNGKKVVLGTLVVTDPNCIEDIQNGIRTELSCGYDCDITEGDSPQQINIRGNHVALCEQGRAGVAKIVDSKKRIKDAELVAGATYTDGTDNWKIIELNNDEVILKIQNKESKLPIKVFNRMLQNYLKPAKIVTNDSGKYIGSYLGRKIYQLNDNLYRTSDRNKMIFESDNLKELKKEIEKESKKKRSTFDSEDYNLTYEEKLFKAKEEALKNLGKDEPELDYEEHQEYQKQLNSAKRNLREEILRYKNKK